MGDQCWYCGMIDGLKRHGLSYPSGGHRNDPTQSFQMLAGRTFRLEEVDHYYDREALHVLQGREVGEA